MIDIPEYMRLWGDEDCNVSLRCYHPNCNSHEHGPVAYYYIDRESLVPKTTYFNTNQLDEFIEYILQHAKSHN